MNPLADTINRLLRGELPETTPFPAPGREVLLQQVQQFRNHGAMDSKQYEDWRADLQRWHLPATSMTQVDELARGQAVAVISGHQPCFQLGPLFVLYKIATTLSLCRWLKSRGVRAVPIFWCASEDHDLGEMLSMTRLNQRGQLQKTSLGASLPQRAAESLPWTERMAKTLLDTLPEAWHPLVITKPLTRYTDHFLHLLYALFLKDGLLIAEPRHFKNAAQPFWQSIASQSHECVRALDEQEHVLLHKNISLQAPRRTPLPIFALHENTGLRTALTLEPAGTWSRPGRFSTTNHPLQLLLPGERLSPGVLLRPLLTQHVLPCAISVLGPAEHRYHQQVEPLYNLLSLPRPVLYPRLSTLNLLQPGNDIQERVLNVFSIFKNMDVFQHFRRQLDDALAQSLLHCP